MKNEQITKLKGKKANPNPVSVGKKSSSVSAKALLEGQYPTPTKNNFNLNNYGKKHNGVASKSTRWTDNGDGTYTAGRGDSASSLHTKIIKDGKYDFTFEEVNQMVQNQHGKNTVNPIDDIEDSNLHEGDVVDLVSKEDRKLIEYLKQERKLRKGGEEEKEEKTTEKSSNKEDVLSKEITKLQNTKEVDDVMGSGFLTDAMVRFRMAMRRIESFFSAEGKGSSRDGTDRGYNFVSKYGTNLNQVKGNMKVMTINYDMVLEWISKGPSFAPQAKLTKGLDVLNKKNVLDALKNGLDDTQKLVDVFTAGWKSIDEISKSGKENASKSESSSVDMMTKSIAIEGTSLLKGANKTKTKFGNQVKDTTFVRKNEHIVDAIDNKRRDQSYEEFRRNR